MMHGQQNIKNITSYNPTQPEIIPDVVLLLCYRFPTNGRTALLYIEGPRIP